jgi:hypothetical protein
MTRIYPPLVLVSLLVGGCYSEGLNIQDLVGTVTVPREMATRTYDDPVSGDEVTRTDVAFIGPVYIGVYAAMDYQIESYPHPILGPSNDAFPYTGTTIGDIRNACVEFLTCKMVSGRFVDYDAIIDFFADVVGTPVVDSADNVITNGEYLRQTCFDLLNYTTDEEIRLLPPDRNDDGAIDAADLDFVEDGDGNFVANFEILQADFYPGMQAWAFVDTPSSESFRLNSCNPQIGYTENTYDRNYRTGAQVTNLLNRPFEYLEPGDWVASFAYQWDDPEEAAEITVDFLVGTNEISELDLSGTAE